MESKSSQKGPQHFFNALEQATPINENDPFADLEPDIYEEEVNEIAVLRRLAYD